MPREIILQTMYTNILTENKDNTCIITINRPDKLNALNHETIQEIGTGAMEIPAARR